MFEALIMLAQEGSGGTGSPNSGTTTTTPPACGGFGLESLLLMAMLFAVMWFVLLRPQRKQEKKRQEMLSQMSRNDQVVTIGGIRGIIYSVDKDEVTLKVDERNDVRLRVSKSAIAQVLEKAEGEKAEEKKS